MLVGGLVLVVVMILLACLLVFVVAAVHLSGELTRESPVVENWWIREHT